ncbi:hypothetical protein DSO57_1030931 [Entomophthora muscae]|uniref:Uncharacterized protein n=1 Tax=Entomophthora muscae TaxID=34485 RepID=A0ACC2SE53_9FUNG|nr:hypothetical protein DSO57_1030931 [Entomophthora muscae]
MVLIVKSWFEGFNVVLMAFSLTFVVHVNCLVLSAYLVTRRAGWWPAWLSLLQAATAMACHTSRLTDFFFDTDCSVKPYHNYTMFCISCCTIDILLVFHIAQNRHMAGCSITAKRLFWLVVAVLPTLAKSVFMIMTITSIQPTTGPFRICSFTMNTTFFHYALTIWAFHHLTMLLLTSTIPLLSHLRVLSLPNSNESIKVCLTHIISILLIILMFFPNPDLDLSDLVMQSYWALKSRTAISLILSLEKSHLTSPDDPQSPFCSFNSTTKFP